jgi:hypothetical protein
LIATQRIDEPDAPGVDSAPVGAHAQPYEVFEAGVVQRREGLRVLEPGPREQAQVGAEHPRAHEHRRGERDGRRHVTRHLECQRLERAPER